MENEMDGLAGQMVATPTGQVTGEDMQLILDEVIRLLSEGTTPEELMEMGVPPEIIEQAMTMMEQAPAPVPNTPPQEDMGLAMSMM